MVCSTFFGRAAFNNLIWYVILSLVEQILIILLLFDWRKYYIGTLSNLWYPFGYITEIITNSSIYSTLLALSWKFINEDIIVYSCTNNNSYQNVSKGLSILVFDKETPGTRVNDIFTGHWR